MFQSDKRVPHVLTGPRYTKIQGELGQGSANGQLETRPPRKGRGENSNALRRRRRGDVGRNQRGGDKKRRTGGGEKSQRGGDDRNQKRGDDERSQRGGGDKRRRKGGAAEAITTAEDTTEAAMMELTVIGRGLSLVGDIITNTVMDGPRGSN